MLNTYVKVCNLDCLLWMLGLCVLAVFIVVWFVVVLVFWGLHFMLLSLDVMLFELTVCRILLLLR